MKRLLVRTPLVLAPALVFAALIYPESGYFSSEGDRHIETAVGIGVPLLTVSALGLLFRSRLLFSIPLLASAVIGDWIYQLAKYDECNCRTDPIDPIVGWGLFLILAAAIAAAVRRGPLRQSRNRRSRYPEA